MNDDVPDTPELELAEKLASFDEALKAGKNVAAGDSAEMRRAQECLKMLEEFWPRHANNAPTLVQPALAAASAITAAPPAPPPASVGRFHIRRELGRGGFGIVYLARDSQLHRDVALKVPRADVVSSPEMRQRFQQEARAAAGLDHPNLVPVYETGDDGSVCWIVSAYCPGINLADWLRQRVEPVPYTEAARLVLSLADGVQHAHSRGILHRDLKPANILLHAEPEPAGRASGSSTFRYSESEFRTPKITDFGLAKLADADMQTKTGTAMGTPAYMAPEQATRGAGEVGPAADVYSLGVILYELVTGRPPFVGDSPLEVLLQARNDEPLPPSRLRHRMPRDLETICLKCLNKEPNRRYPTARALADDLRRFLTHEPIKARPVGKIERAARWARRRPAVTGLMALLALTLCAAVGGISWQWWRAERNAGQASRERDIARHAERKEASSLDRTRIRRAYDEWMADDARASAELLMDAGGARRDSWERRYVHRLCSLGLHTFEDHQQGVSGVEFTRDGRKLVTAGRDGAVVIRHLPGGKMDRLTLGKEHDDVYGLSLNPADDRFAAAITTSGFVHLIDLHEVRVVTSWKVQDQPGGAPRLRFSSDGTKLATACRTAIKLWDVRDQKELRTLTAGGDVFQIRWSPDNKLISVAARSSEIRVWDVATGEIKHRLWTIHWQSNCIAFSPDGRFFAWGGMDGVVGVHDTTTFERVATLAGLPGWQVCVSFSPDNQFVAAGSMYGPVKVWNVYTHQLVRTLHGHTGGMRDIAFGPDGATLATAGSDHRVVVWDMTDEQTVAVLTPRTAGRCYAAAFSPDSRRLVTGVRSVRQWDVERHEMVANSGEPDLAVFSIAFHPSGGHYAGGDHLGRIRVFTTTTGREVASETMSGYPYALQYINAGQRLLVAGWDNAICAWDPESKEKPKVLAGPLGKADRAGIDIYESCRAAFSPDGQWLAYAERGQPTAIWDVTKGEKVAPLADSPRNTSALAIDKSGKLLAVGGSRGDIQVREVPSGRLIATLAGHPSEIIGLTFTPDSKRLASSARDSVVKIWDLDAHVETLSLRGEATFDTIVAFSPDGALLFAGGWDGFHRVWTNRDPKSESAEDRQARVRNWHAVIGPELMHRRNLHGARVHLDRWVEVEPDNPHARYERGFLYAAFGDWNAAAAEMDRALAKPNCGLGCHVDRALLYLRAGDMANYRRLSTRAYNRFAKGADWGTVNRLGWYTLLGDPPGLTAEQGLAIGEAAITKAQDWFQRSSGALTFGLALYRAGRFDDALKQLEESERSRAIPETWYLLAVVHQQKGNTAKAREYFERAAKELEVARTKPTLTDGRNADWRRRAELELLHAEAKKALDEKK